VLSGTKVDLNYCIEEIIDEEVKEEIYDYFRETDTDDLVEAVNEFDGEFELDEMATFRIQFISDFAN
jgi:ATP-dependent DNA helicase RecQ